MKPITHSKWIGLTPLRGLLLNPWLLSGLLLTALPACGGSNPEPNNPTPPPDPSLDEETEAAPASSPAVQKAMDALSQEDFATAKKLLEEALSKTPDDPQAVFYMGVALAGLGETAAAVEQMEKALKLKPDFSEASINLSALLLDTEQPKAALEAANHGLKSAPNDANLLQNKGMALFDLGDNAGAAAALQKSVELAPDNEELRFIYAQALAGSGDSAGAVKELKRLTGSEQIEVLASVADQLGRQKAWPECVAALDKAITKQENAELYVKRGLCKHGQDDEDGAKADFEKAIALDENSAKGHFYLGQNLKTRGDKKGAKKAFEKAAALDSGQLGEAAKKAAKGL